MPVPHSEVSAKRCLTARRVSSRRLRHSPEIPDRFGLFNGPSTVLLTFFIRNTMSKIIGGIALITPTAASHSNFEWLSQTREKPLNQNLCLECSFTEIALGPGADS
jgi:hypothetical protein